MWLPVKGFERYEVSDEGQVRSLSMAGGKGSGKGNGSRGRMLKLKLDEDGYFRAALCANGKVSSKFVHALVLEAFIGPRPPGAQCCHNDGNPANNHPSNLRWDTCAKNQADRIAHGTDPKGERNPNCKHSEATIKSVFELRKAGLKYKEIEKRTGVSWMYAWNIVRGLSWKHLNGTP